MKKILSVIMAVTMALALTACGERDASAPADQVPQVETEKVQEQESKDSISQVEKPEETLNQENPYTLEVTITGEKTADILLGGLKTDNNVEGARWCVEFDNKYSVELRVYVAGEYQCHTSLRKDNPDGTYDMPMLSLCEYEIIEDSILFHADFSSTEHAELEDTADVSQFTTATIVVDETGTGYKPITVAFADVVTNDIAPTNEDAVQIQKPDADNVVYGNNQYSGLYTSGRGTLTVTDNTIVLIFDEVEYSGDYTETDIKGQNGIGEFVFSANGAEVKMFFGTDRKVVEVYVGNDGAGFTRGESGNMNEQAPVISGKFSALSGTYKGDKSTLTIKEDGVFSYVFSSSSLQETFNGQLAEGFKSGDKLQCGDYSIEFLFPEDYRYFSLVVWDANGNNMGGEDLSKQ